MQTAASDQREDPSEHSQRSESQGGSETRQRDEKGTTSTGGASEEAAAISVVIVKVGLAAENVINAPTLRPLLVPEGLICDRSPASRSRNFVAVVNEVDDGRGTWCNLG